MNGFFVCVRVRSIGSGVGVRVGVDMGIWLGGGAIFD